MGLLLVMTAAFNGYRKAPYALYRAYGGPTRPYTRYKTATMDWVMTTILGLLLGTGRPNQDIYQKQDSLHGPYTNYDGHPQPYSGHMNTSWALISRIGKPPRPYIGHSIVKLNFIPGKRRPLQHSLVRPAILGLTSGKGQSQCALYRAYHGHNGPYNRYKTATGPCTSH